MTHYPDASIIPFNGKTPKIHPTAFIAPGCRIIGDVEIGAESSIWYNCVLRGDISHIRIGERTNVQDGSIIHVDGDKGEGDVPTIIGNDVLIGHLAMVHSCVIQDFGFVGMSSIVMEHCVVESDAMLAAGAMLTPGKTVPSRQLWSGRPAKFMRELDDRQVAFMRAGASHYVHNAKEHIAALAAMDERARSPVFRA